MKLRLKVIEVNGAIRAGTYSKDRDPTVIETVVQRIMEDMMYGREARRAAACDTRETRPDAANR